MNTLITLVFLALGLWAVIEIYKHVKDILNER